MTQTTDGFLWVAGRNGLYRFDGVRFERVRPGSGGGLLKDEPGNLVADGKNGLWVTYRFGGASYIKDGRITNYTEKDGLPAAPRGVIFHLAIDPQQTVWAATIRGLFRLEGSRWHQVGKEWDFPYPAARTVWADREGTLWVSAMNKLVFLPRGSTKFKSTRFYAPADAILAETKDGTLWLASANTGTLQTFRRSMDDTIITGPKIHAALNHELLDHNGSLWMASDADGLLRIPDPQKFLRDHPSLHSKSVEHYMEQQGLSGNSVYWILEDREGSIWVLTSKGIDQFRQPTLTRLKLPESTFFSVTPDAHGSMLIGSSDYLLHWKETATRIPTPPFSDGEGSGLTAAWRDEDGAIWLGGANLLWRYKDGHIFPLKPPPDMNSISHDVQAITKDHSGSLWVSFSGNGTYRLANARWSRIDIFPGMPTIPAIAMLTDHTGAVWFVSVKDSVFVLQPNHAHPVPLTAGVDLESVMAIFERKGQIWIGGQLGIEVMENGTFHHLRGADNEDFNNVTGIASDRRGDLWINAGGGVIHITSSELQEAQTNPGHQIHYELFDELDGLSDAAMDLRPLPTVAVSPSDQIYFSMRKAVFRIDPTRIYRNPMKPSVEITSMIVDGHTTLSPRDITLHADSQNFEVDYTASSLLIPQRVRFRYKLDGYDTEWQDANGRRQAFYSHLPPGSYTFHVIASNNDGVWNETGATAAFYLPPTFVQTVWFKILCLAASLASVWLLYQIRLRRALQAVRERLSERLRERERIARELHDTLLQGMQALVLRFQSGVLLLDPSSTARFKLDEALRQADRVLAEGRDCVLDLRSDTLEKDDLPLSLIRLATELAENSTARFHVNVLGEVCELHPMILDETFRIGKEAICNAFQHAEATDITAEVGFGKKVFSLVVKDNGVGIREEILTKGRRTLHWGLPGMRERAFSIGGTLNVQSRAGQGTQITLNLPAMAAYRDEHMRGHRLWPFYWLKRLFTFRSL